MNRVIIETIARNGLRIFGAWLATKGLVGGSDFESLSGALVVAVGEAWSFWEKRHDIRSHGTTTTPKTIEEKEEEK